jgi:phosphate transport system substrate-binding protein
MSLILKTFSTRTMVVLLFLVAALQPTPLLAQETIRIGGTGTGLGTISLLASAFQKKHPEIKIRIMPSIGSSGAIKATAQGALDIGLNGRPLTDEESGLGLVVTKYAKTPFVFAVRKDVPVRDLTSAELVSIYTGAMTAWPNGEWVRVVLRPASDADTIIARGISPEMNTAVGSALAREGMLMAATNQESNEMIDKTSGSIGFSTLTQIMTENHPVKALAINGVEAIVQGKANRKYPFMKTLSMLTKPAALPAVQQFIDFVRSTEGTQLLQKTGNIPMAGK